MQLNYLNSWYVLFPFLYLNCKFEAINIVCPTKLQSTFDANLKWCKCLFLRQVWSYYCLLYVFITRCIVIVMGHSYPRLYCYSSAGMDMAQLICRSCRTLLMYARGATSVRCSCCHNVNLATGSICSLILKKWNTYFFYVLSC